MLPCNRCIVPEEIERTTIAELDALRAVADKARAFSHHEMGGELDSALRALDRATKRPT